MFAHIRDILNPLRLARQAQTLINGSVAIVQIFARIASHEIFMSIYSMLEVIDFTGVAQPAIIIFTIGFPAIRKTLERLLLAALRAYAGINRWHYLSTIL
jgi:hypothetical protein